MKLFIISSHIKNISVIYVISSIARRVAVNIIITISAWNGSKPSVSAVKIVFGDFIFILYHFSQIKKVVRVIVDT